jgi:gliding motility-associated lipoprotein GldH
MRFLLPFVLLLILCSCGPKYVLNEELELPNQSWTYADSLVAELNVPSAGMSYNLYVEVAHSTNFPSQNLYVRLKTSTAQGPQTSEAISLELADNMGNWLGKCSGERCKRRILVKPDLKFTQKGKYRLVLEQFMRSEKITGVSGLALQVGEIEP